MSIRSPSPTRWIVALCAIGAALRSTAAPETFSDALKKQVVQSLGIPYKDGPLGEGPGAKYDTDPLIDPAHVDCVTFVEQSVAFAATTSDTEAAKLLQKIRYADGKVDYEARHHFFITDWIAHNTFCRDVTETLGVLTEKITRTISRREFFKKQNAPELGTTTPDRRQTVAYVPASLGAVAEAKLPDVALLIFVGKIDWLFALHCGFYVRNKDGSGLLYHASSKAGTVSAVPLITYLGENKTRYLGFTAYEVNAPNL